MTLNTEKKDQPDLSFSVGDSVTLKNETQATYDFDTIGPGGVAVKKYEIFIASEGGLDAGPFVARYDKYGTFKNYIPIPPPEGRFHHKRIFDSLTLLGKEILYTAVERPFVENPAQHVPIYKYLASEFKMGRTLYYPLSSPSHYRAQYDSTDVETSLTEIWASAEDHFITIETAYFPKEDKNVVRIFDADCTGEKCIKSLMADMDDLIQDSEIKIEKLGRVEAVSRGPRIPGGKPSLLLATDNDFKEGIGTQIFWLEML